MALSRFDVTVVGAGPAGSAAALVLARGGARVALIDWAQFPRDKACGDLIGPRGVRSLNDLRVGVATATEATAMRLIGPNGKAVVLPWREGTRYPGRAIVVPRLEFDTAIRTAALEAGAHERAARVVAIHEGGRGVVCDDGTTIRSDFVIGADGALSRVAAGAGLVRGENVLWGFALRSYVHADVDCPTVFLWEPTPWRCLAGYGWLFPGPDGRANVGLGIGVGSNRPLAARASDLFPGFLELLRRNDILAVKQFPENGARKGGWLKLGIVGTAPARDRILLIGDAAGLVNPLQGEGIAEAIESGRAGANAILGSPGTAADAYLEYVAKRFAPFHTSNAVVHRLGLRCPWLLSAAGRLLTLAGSNPAIATGWGIYWNDLAADAHRGWPRRIASSLAAVSEFTTRRSGLRRETSDGGLVREA